MNNFVIVQYIVSFSLKYHAVALLVLQLTMYHTADLGKHYESLTRPVEDAKA